MQTAFLEMTWFNNDFCFFLINYSTFRKKWQEKTLSKFWYSKSRKAKQKNVRIFLASNQIIFIIIKCHWFDLIWLEWYTHFFHLKKFINKQFNSWFGQTCCYWPTFFSIWITFKSCITNATWNPFFKQTFWPWIFSRTDTWFTIHIPIFICTTFIGYYNI